MHKNFSFSLFPLLSLGGILLVSVCCSVGGILYLFEQKEWIKQSQEEVFTLLQQKELIQRQQRSFPLLKSPIDINSKVSSLSFLTEEKKVLNFLSEHTFNAEIFEKRKTELGNNALLFHKEKEDSKLGYHQEVYSQVTPIQIDHNDLLRILSLIENDPHASLYFKELSIEKKEGLCGEYLEFSSQLVQRYQNP